MQNMHKLLFFDNETESNCQTGSNRQHKWEISSAPVRSSPATWIPETSDRPCPGEQEKRNNRDKIRQLRDEARINQESWPKLFSAFFSHFIASSTCSNFCTWTHISASRLSSQGLQAESTSRHETKICSKLIVALPQQSTFIILCQPLTHPEKIRSKMQRSGQRQSLCFSE